MRVDTTKEVESITLGQDCTYFVQTDHGVDITRQWYNGQTITDPVDVAEILAHNPVIREVTYVD